jgi:peptidoglycan DL-endopeptidase CwlO
VIRFNRQQAKQKLVMKAKNLAVNRQTALFAIVMILIGTLFGVPIVNADRFQEQINQLSNENSQVKEQVNSLQSQAASYQDAINYLQAQINTYQQQIVENEKKNDELKRKIAEAEAELERQKDLLGQNIKAMYLEGDISTIEMLATSKDLSDYFDKEQYRNVVKTKIKNTLDKINALKAELKTQKEEVERLIKEQEELRAQASAQKAEQNRLLNFNQSQQAEYNEQIKNNQEKINELKRQQAIENARLFGGTGGVLGGGGYPWGSAACYHTGQVEGYCYNYDWAVNGQIYNWQTGGYGYRNCTDWVAFRVRIAGGRVPSGMGNANTWDDRGPSYGYEVSSTPREGAAAVSNRGYYGHVMYVEAVNGDGSIVVSDYNRAGTGKYDMNTLSASTASALRYVYF